MRLTNYKRLPRISTRGYYDLVSAERLKSDSYNLYPQRWAESVYGAKEIVIMIHGLRNDKSSALTKFIIAKKRLSKLGYRYNVIGYSYDANTRGAHVKSTALRALKVGQKIAQQNGNNLSKFILDFKRQSPKTKIRLMGHSLGAQVILSTIDRLSRYSNADGIIESVHIFGASIFADSANPRKSGRKMQKIISQKIVNYYSPSDEVLRQAHEDGSVKNPIGFCGAIGKTIPKYSQKKVSPKNHRFASYAAVLRTFP